MKNSSLIKISSLYIRKKPDSILRLRLSLSRTWGINALSMLFFYYIILFLFFGKTAKCQSIVLSNQFDEMKYHYCYSAKFNNDTIKVIFYKSDIEEDEVYNLSDSLCRYPEIYRNNKLIFKVDGNKNCNGSFSYTRKDIKIICVDNKYFYVILLTKNVLYSNIVISDTQTGEKIYLNCSCKSYFDDFDLDGYFEVGGSDYAEGLCENYSTYAPTIIYKLTSTIQLDSIISKKLTLEDYMEFHGFHYSDSSVKRR